MAHVPTQKADSNTHTSHTTAAPQGEATNKDEAKKAVNKYKAPDPPGYMDVEHLQRAATEYMVALRPQPSPQQMESVDAALAEKDDKGELKHKCKSSDDVPAVVDGLLKPAA